MEERKTSCEIEFGLLDVTAKEDSRLAVTDQQPWGDAENQLRLAEQVLPAYGTMEFNQFLLDGKREAMPDDPENHFFGWWSSSMSDEAGLFVDPIVLQVAFSDVHSSLGITFSFDEGNGDFCSHLNIQWYARDGSLMQDQDFYPDRARWFADCQVNDYMGLEITFYKTKRPYRYLKLTEIMYGMIKTFGDGDLISATLLEEVDPLADSLPVSTLTYRFYSRSGTFDILDMQGAWSLFQWKQWMHVFETANGQRTPMGTYYLNEPEADSENTTTMNCIDLLGVIDQSDFKGGMYENVRFGDLLAEIMESADGPDGFEIDQNLAEVRLSGWMPICTHRQAVQLAAFAAGAVVNSTRSSRIHLTRLPEAAEDAIPYSRKMVGHKVKMNPLVTGVEVTAHSYQPMTETEDERELHSDRLDEGEHEITFSEPMHSLTVIGAEIIDSNVNYAVLSVPAAGDVVLKGKPYNDTTSVFRVSMEHLPANEKDNIKKVENATLISPDTAQDAAQRIYNYFQLRYQDEGDLILDGEQAGQRVILDSMGRRQIDGIIERLEIDLTDGFLGKAKITGKAVE